MKTDVNIAGVNAGLEGWKGTTPKWAAIASNYLMLATIGLFVISGFINDWSAFIPDTSKFVIEEAISAIEKSFVTIATALRFLGVNKND
jgi:hypothetical protein